MSDQPLRLFREMCGADGDIELEISHVVRGKAYRTTFPLPFLVVGRHANADLVLADAEVGQRHAYLQLIDGRLRCIDLDSRTGIIWDDGDRESGWFSAWRGVTIGPYRIRHLAAAADDDGDDPQDPQSTMPADRDGWPAVSLEFTNPEPGPTLWAVNRVLSLVGRSPSCKVQLPCPSVCKFHCGLLRTSRGLWVTDLLGGVFVNGERVRFAHLADRDQLWVGGYSIRVHYDPPPHAVSAVARRDRVRSNPPAQRVATALAATGSPRWQPGDPVAGDLATMVPVGLDLAEPALVPLVNQFAQMQQHMLDQFQQTMLAMVQTFGKLHRDQTELVRQELSHLHKLTAELNALRQELSAGPAGKPQAAAPAGSRPADGRLVSASEPAAPANGRPAGPPSKQQPADVHTWLQARFDALQRERQSHWQKLLAFLRKAPRQAAPAGDASP
jgi:hypothetical protein